MTDLKSNSVSITALIQSQNYFLIARILPAILSLFPPLTFYFYYINAPVVSFTRWLYHAEIVLGTSVPLALIYVLAQVNRFIAKEFFEVFYFHNGSQMPTTNYLLYANSHYSTDYKKLIHAKIRSDFGVKLLSARAEGRDENLARKKIVEAVWHIKRRVGNGKLVLQHNIEYGFFRNLIGGSVLAAILSLFNLWFFTFFNYNPIAVKISIGFFIGYMAIVLLSKFIMVRVGNRYAAILIQEYMGLHR